MVEACSVPQAETANCNLQIMATVKLQEVQYWRTTVRDVLCTE
jgi:hypothetical protein